jgi:hypothetical protein
VWQYICHNIIDVVPIEFINISSAPWLFLLYFGKVFSVKKTFPIMEDVLCLHTKSSLIALEPPTGAADSRACVLSEK